MPPYLKSSTSHSKRGSTPVPKLAGGIEPPPLHTQYRTTQIQDKHVQDSRTSYAGTRLSKIAKNTLTQTPKKANITKWTLTKTSIKTHKHTHSSKDWDQYNQQRRPEDPEERIDSLTKARTKKKGKKGYNEIEKPASPTLTLLPFLTFGWPLFC